MEMAQIILKRTAVSSGSVINHAARLQQQTQVTRLSLSRLELSSQIKWAALPPSTSVGLPLAEQIMMIIALFTHLSTNRGFKLGGRDAATLNEQSNIEQPNDEYRSITRKGRKLRKDK